MRAAGGVRVRLGARGILARGRVAGRVDAGDELLAQSRLPLGEHDLGQGAALRGGHLEHDLVGLELDQHVSALDPVAGPEVPGEELRVRYRFGEGGDPHVYEHERTPRRCRAGSSAEDDPRCLRRGAKAARAPARHGTRPRAGMRTAAGTIQAVRCLSAASSSSPSADSTSARCCSR